MHHGGACTLAEGTQRASLRSGGPTGAVSANGASQLDRGTHSPRPATSANRCALKNKARRNHRKWPGGQKTLLSMSSYDNPNKNSTVPLAVIEAWFAGRRVIPLRPKDHPACPGERIPLRQPTLSEVFQWHEHYQPAAWAIVTCDFHALTLAVEVVSTTDGSKVFPLGGGEL